MANFILKLARILAKPLTMAIVSLLSSSIADWVRRKVPSKEHKKLPPPAPTTETQPIVLQLHQDDD